MKARKMQNAVAAETLADSIVEQYAKDESALSVRATWLDSLLKRLIGYRDDAQLNEWFRFSAVCWMVVLLLIVATLDYMWFRCVFMLSR